MYVGIFFITLSVIFFGLYLFEQSKKAVPKLKSSTDTKKTLKKKVKKTQPKKVFERITIYYATESGTAENFACLLAEDAMNYKIPCRVMDVKTVDPEI